MTRGLIIVKVANVEQARMMVQQLSFAATPEEAAAFLVPANPVYAADGMTITTPATLYYASGLFEDDFWQAVVQTASALKWCGTWEYDTDADPTFPQRQIASINVGESFSVR
jgi:hypothetical protein